MKPGDLVTWTSPTMPNVLPHPRGVGIVLDVRNRPGWPGRARVLFTPGSESIWFRATNLTLVSSYPDH